jgi:hypothetical protein
MTPEQEARAQRIAEERDALQREMAKPNFDIGAAGVTRVQAWTHAWNEASKVLRRHPMDTAPYIEARLNLQGIGRTDPENLARQLWDR